MYKGIFALAVPAIALSSKGPPPKDESTDTTNKNKNAAKLHFYLVRHGEELADTVVKYKKNYDTCLTPEGTLNNSNMCNRNMSYSFPKREFCFAIFVFVRY